MAYLVPRLPRYARFLGISRPVLLGCHMIHTSSTSLDLNHYDLLGVERGANLLTIRKVLHNAEILMLVFAEHWF